MFLVLHIRAYVEMATFGEFIESQIVFEWIFQLKRTLKSLNLESDVS